MIYTEDGQPFEFSAFEKALKDKRFKADVVSSLKKLREALALYASKETSEGLTDEEAEQVVQIIRWMKAYVIALGHERVVDTAEAMLQEPGNA